MAAHSRKKLDLTGQRYGKLTVLGPAENVGVRTAWHCRCDCGDETVVKTYHLRSGHVTSCGCIPRVTYVDGTCVEMLQANSLRKNNTSGVPGVDWRADKGTWRATICFKGKRHYLGCYARWEDAVKARRDAEERLIVPFLAQFEDSSSVQDGDPPVCAQSFGKGVTAMQAIPPGETAPLYRSGGGAEDLQDLSAKHWKQCDAKLRN